MPDLAAAKEKATARLARVFSSDNRTIASLQLFTFPFAGGLLVGVAVFTGDAAVSFLAGGSTVAGLFSSYAMLGRSDE